MGSYTMKDMIVTQFFCSYTFNDEALSSRYRLMRPAPENRPCIKLRHSDKAFYFFNEYIALVLIHALSSLIIIKLKKTFQQGYLTNSIASFFRQPNPVASLNEDIL